MSLSCGVLTNAVRKCRQGCLTVQTQGEDFGNCNAAVNSVSASMVSILSVTSAIGECRELCMQI